MIGRQRYGGSPVFLMEKYRLFCHLLPGASDCLQSLILRSPALIVIDEERAPDLRIFEEIECAKVTLAGPDVHLSELSESELLRAPSRKKSIDRTAYLIFTSGTTSAPKGVAISHESLLAQLKTISRVLEVSSDSKIFNGLVLYHVDGLVQGPVLAASRSATLLRPDKLNANRIEEGMCWLRDSGATHMIGVPVLYEMILRFCSKDGLFRSS